MVASRRAHVIDAQSEHPPYWSRVLRGLRRAAGLTLTGWVVELQETPREWAELLDGAAAASDPDQIARAEQIRREAGIYDARHVRLLTRPIPCSVDTVQRWESGRLVPGAAAQEAIIVTCLVRDLFGAHPQAPFQGDPITPGILRRLLAEARLNAGARQ
jgi:hypothetical protein